ncbi:Trafficking protein particle complex subunit 13 [Colletotrichum tanaceti]|uniref:Trafficking protein particle complex subunit 13 n=1 Tax=Colletotrichum tanaceti TaxID=1306861 RepID=A0A4U6XTW7_9PEZI|nr:Trafficking protein particle complex subunit 13 [Colletotrichum tanaceti]TKW59425.1 Trafficking protein particle complex subunit 13 [Colletotrichum tanaceti]
MTTRLSRPSLVIQHPVRPPLTPVDLPADPTPASLAYDTNASTNPAPFLLSPILNLPLSFGSAYVGEVFSCTLCANHDVPDPAMAPLGPGGQPLAGAASPKRKSIRDVRIEAEMKTPGANSIQKLELSPPNPSDDTKGTDLDPGDTLQRIVNFDLKEEGNHVLAVTVSYYEATETSGKTRTFRKLYQFICKSSLIVRTKIGPLAPAARHGGRRWALEAQLENCSEDIIQLEKVVLDLADGLGYADCNWEAGRGGGDGDGDARPVLHPGEVEQVCFVVEEAGGSPRAQQGEDGRIMFGILGIGWRGEMGNRGFLSTGKLGTRPIA